jgi:hypothetical protein
LDNKELSWANVSPFHLMLMLFAGLMISGLYGLLGLILISSLNGKTEAQHFFTSYTSSFKTILSFGLVLGLAPMVYKYQNAIPQTIEAAFAKEELSLTDYFKYKQRFFSLFRSVTFSAEFFVVAFVIFSYARFLKRLKPLSQKKNFH